MGQRVELGLIPAWAGSTLVSRDEFATTSAHPRVGGEHEGGKPAGVRDRGSSPRGRGAPRRHWRGAVQAGLIPAWAGSTSTSRRGRCPATAHPRVGGEHLGVRVSREMRDGSSPRGRGALGHHEPRVPGLGLIPAWAGSTRILLSLDGRASAHPRVGGEHYVPAEPILGGQGSSPRGRGAPARLRLRPDRVRLIPAWAGSTRASGWWDVSQTAHPRVGGEHVGHVLTAPAVAGSSPRGRGARVAGHVHGDLHRLIPAWAGSTRPAVPARPARRAHPRVGGEHVVTRPRRAMSAGSSPRGRGARLVRSTQRQRDGLIPAWAGSTLDDLQ